MMISWKTYGGELHEARVPAHVLPFVEVLGIEKAVRFFLQLGHLYIHFPKKFSKHGDRSILATVISQDELTKLTEIIGAGQTIRLPFPAKFIAQYLRSTGASQSQISAAVKRSDGSVAKYLNSPRTLKSLASKHTIPRSNGSSK